MRVAILTFALLAAGGSPTRAQQHDPPLPDSTLQTAVRLATEGRGDSARTLVRARLRVTPAGDTLLPAVLFAAGVVAAEQDSAAAYFRRVSVEFSNSAWAPAALVRLAQFAFAARDYGAVLRTTDRARLDYPPSVQRAAAVFWGARARLELGETGPGCSLLRQAESEAGDDVELANRARFYLLRCASLADTTTRADTTGHSATVVFTVQVAAVRSPLAADALMRDLRAAGYDPRVMREPDGMLKVRVGRFATRAEAQRLIEPLRRRFGGSPFVVEEQR
ncbi:MAG TPA: SPOR domain-containing protein [Gemmatimonadales bacterium]|nr:SPOR domain-containing protein [Gemmatimonadales bacterium]